MLALHQKLVQMRQCVECGRIKEGFQLCRFNDPRMAFISHSFLPVFHNASYSGQHPAFVCVRRMERVILKTPQDAGLNTLDQGGSGEPVGTHAPPLTQTRLRSGNDRLH